jgi:AraC family transcriptional regulator, carnitine catabolism transcriptional activator
MNNVRTPLVPNGAAYFRVDTEASGATRFVFLLCPSFTLLAMASAIEPLRIANQLSQRALYDWRTWSIDGRPVPSSCGLSVEVDEALAVDRTRDDILMVCAGNVPSNATAKEVVDVIRMHHRHGGWVGGICTGPFALAKAGLLEKCSFTLHWENQPAFRESFPSIEPTVNKYEIDNKVLTCSGGTASADMMIDLIGRDHGAAFAAIVSDMCLRRVPVGKDLHQRSAVAAVAQVRNPGLSAIVDLMHRNREEPLSMDELAERVGYSRRHIERLFDQSLSVTPARFYRNLRLDYARNLLASTEMSLSEVAAACGFETKSHFSKCFIKRFGCAPSRLHCRI